MECLAVDALRESPDALVRRAEEGRLSLVVDSGAPVFIAVPFDATLLRHGALFALAIKLYEQEDLSLGEAARVAGMGRIEFMNRIGRLGIPVVRYSPEELECELQSLDSRPGP